MRVVGFVGPSGTGKSYRSMWLAKEQHLDFIIDDGLLISHHKIVAGRSAKQEKTKIGSIKRALFVDEDHRRAVAKAIAQNQPEGLLVLGTSVGMVNKIVSALGLHAPDQFIMIEDVATKEEINLALRSRREQGKHVIPVPTFEIKEAFSGYLVDPLKIFKRRSNNKMYVAEKSIVRPAFSYMGDFKIYDNVLCQMCAHEAKQCDGVYKVQRVTVYSQPDGMVFSMDVTLDYGVDLHQCAAAIQQRVKEPIEAYTSLVVAQVDVNIVRLHVLEQKA